MMKTLFAGHSIVGCTDDDDHQGATPSPDIGIARSLQIPHGVFVYPEFSCELTRAELGGEISELCALSFQAVLAIVEDAPFVNDYLRMARSLAVSPPESSLLRRIEEVHRLAQDKAPDLARQCLALIARLCTTPSLRQALGLALLSIADQAAIDAVLAEHPLETPRASCTHGQGSSVEPVCPKPLCQRPHCHDLDETMLS